MFVWACVHTRVHVHEQDARLGRVAWVAAHLNAATSAKEMALWVPSRHKMTRHLWWRRPDSPTSLQTNTFCGLVVNFILHYKIPKGSMPGPFSFLIYRVCILYRGDEKFLQGSLMDPPLWLPLLSCWCLRDLPVHSVHSPLWQDLCCQDHFSTLLSPGVCPSVFFISSWVRV